MKTAPNHRCHRAAGFTLLELAVVILVMLVLAGLLLRAARIASDRAKIARCKNELASLRVAIDQYYKDNRIYPATGTANQSDSLVRALVGANLPKNYVDWPTSRLTPAGFLDPWGRAYGYARVSAGLDFWDLGRQAPYALISYGPDSIAANGDDISLGNLPTN